MTLDTAKGTRDVFPQDMLIMQNILRVFKQTFQVYGFNPLDTPILERFETLASKYTGGAEILKETFQLQDQGERKLGLRYDLTVPFSRFIAMNPTMKMPFKRYQIGKVFRDGPVSSSRLREFTQCDCDVVGTSSLAADAECVLLFYDVFHTLDVNIVVRVNNRKILDAIMESVRIPQSQRSSVILAIDKLDKKSTKDVMKEIADLKISHKTIDALFSLILVTGTNEKKLAFLEEKLGLCDGIVEMRSLLSFCSSSGVSFIPSLARGLAYYTGSIFEVYEVGKEQLGALGSGGRYDTMIGSLLGSGEYPAVGCSFGLDRIMLTLKDRQKHIPQTVVTAYVIPIGVSLSEVWPFIVALRQKKIAVDCDLMGRSISKNLNYVNTMNIPLSIIIGKKELDAKSATVRDMVSGKEELVSLKTLSQYLMKKGGKV